MSTPELVLRQPDLPVPMPAMPAHHVALLLAGLASYSAKLTELREWQALTADGFTERHDPVVVATSQLEAALTGWATTHRLTPPADGQCPQARWPAGPDVALGDLPVAALWAARLGADFLFLDLREADRDPDGESTYDPYNPKWAPVQAARRGIAAAAQAGGIEG